MNVLEVRGLKKSFRRELLITKTEVLRGVDLSLTAGSVTAFLGANGAGKTTTVKCILGLLQKDAGEITFFGDQKLSNAVKARIGFLPERAFFYEYLTGIEFLQFYAQLSGRWDRKKAEALIDRVGLGAAMNRKLRFYSKGMLQKIGLAQALIHEPEIVILDEPMSGLDPDGRFAVAEIIVDIAKKGTAVFFSSHLINDAEKFCNRVIMLKDGRTLYEGGLESLLAQTQKGYQVMLLKNDQPYANMVANETDLQSELRRAVSGGEQVLEISPIRMTLEEIFVTRALREKSDR